MDRLYQAKKSYEAAFGNEGPHPPEVADEDLAEALEQAVSAGAAIEEGRDWSRDRATRDQTER